MTRSDDPKTQNFAAIGVLTVAVLLACAFAAGCASLSGGGIIEERDVLGVPLRIEVRDPDPERAAEATRLAFLQAKRVGKLLLADRRTSIFGILNGLPPDREIGVSDEAKTIVKRALQIAKITKGAYTPTRNVLLKFWGISDGQPRVPSDDEIANGVLHAAWNRLELDEKHSRILRRGFYSKIDLEGVTVGAIVEIAALTLQEQGVPAAHVQSGGVSSVYTEEGGDPWSLEVMGIDEDGQRRVLGRVDIREGGFASVAPQKLFVLEDGTRIHELIDPRNGRPVNDVNAAAVRSSRASTAAGLAWAAFVLGDRAPVHLIKYPDIAWLIDTHQHGLTHTPDLAPSWAAAEQASGS